MLLGDGCAGKTTLKYGLMLSSTPQYEEELRVRLRKQVRELWTTAGPVLQWLRKLGASEQTLQLFENAITLGMQSLIEMKRDDLKRLCKHQEFLFDRIVKCLDFIDPPEPVPQTAQELREKLSQQGLPRDFIYSLEEQRIDLHAFVTLSNEELKELGLTTLGDRRSAQRIQQSLKSQLENASSRGTGRYEGLLSIPHVWTEGIDVEEWKSTPSTSGRWRCESQPPP